MLFDPDTFYDEADLSDKGLSSSVLATARKSGVLRHARIGTRFIYRGSWVIAWIDGESKGGQPR